MFRRISSRYHVINCRYKLVSAEVDLNNVFSKYNLYIFACLRRICTWIISTVKFHTQDQKRRVMSHIRTMRIAAMKIAIHRNKPIKWKCVQKVQQIATKVIKVLFQLREMLLSSRVTEIDWKTNKIANKT